MSLSPTATPTKIGCAAQAYAQQARRLATCDGPPDYTYKVAYEEAGAMLKQLGERI